jgi:hypothetical protein
MTCLTCGCDRHVTATTWRVTCTVCDEERWPTAVERPTAYVCTRCRATTPETRAARRAAAQKTGQARPPGGPPAPDR